MVGAALGTLPDLDVVIDYGSDVANFTYHRGFSHSLFVLAPFSVLLWGVLKGVWKPVGSAPKHWFFAITLSLVTHPLLDAHTVYGTQLWWPIPTNPIMWSTLFIIDPLYTLPILAAALLVLWRPRQASSRTWLLAGLLLSQTYLIWSWVAKFQVTTKIQQSLDNRGIPNARFLSTPTPMNTLMWRAVVLTDNGYLEGLYSLPVDRGRIQWRSHEFNRNLLVDTQDIWAVDRLRWFTSDFVSAQQVGNRLVVTDLRMGTLYPSYVFRHQVAHFGPRGWEPSEPMRESVELPTEDLGFLWQRLWDPAVSGL